uniref:Zona pellucida sperm-binding protein 3 n=1 Tax=Salarias fasciatus TaxID=181472 RepID=A0A672IWM3_SALFA
MDRSLRPVCPCWIVLLCSVSTLAQSRWGIREPAGPQRVDPPLGPLPPRLVSVRCLPDSLEVVVQADLFDTGLRVDGGDLRLGSSPAEAAGCGAAPSGEAEFTLRASLMDCGIKLSSTEEKIIYSTVLVYSPEPDADGLIKLEGATIPVECHYEKIYSVDSSPLQPAWIPSVSTISADNQINFNLLLMSDDWQYERGSSVYFLGDPMNFEVSAVVAHHRPVRVYVDHCVATATPDAESTKRYNFIENNGCLTDASVTNSNSRFLPRVDDSKLRFTLEAFRFYGESSHQVFISCQVKAVIATTAVTSESRACSFIDNSWQSVDGGDHVCSSCDLSRPFENRPTTEASGASTTAVTRPAETSAGSVRYKPRSLPAMYVRFRPGLPVSNERDERLSPKLAKRGTNDRAEGTIQLAPIIVLPSRAFGSNLSNPKAVSAKRKST